MVLKLKQRIVLEIKKFWETKKEYNKNVIIIFVDMPIV